MKPFILFVCTGNICRSPMAVALLEQEAMRRGDGGRYRIESAGTWGLDGEPAAEFARAAMAKRGLSIVAHRGRMITGDLIDKSDLLIVMTRDHQHALGAEFPAARDKIHLLTEMSSQKYDIADPYGRPAEAYETCASELERLIQDGYPQIARLLEMRENESPAAL